ncbi:MAG: T9SS type A sorting domain-containing protein [Crocinitomix sp.]|nr:T9SS type A sorting domain-containing protein [Crocinitomix sp.]
MKKLLPITLAALVLSCGQNDVNPETVINTESEHTPIPTVVFENMADEEAYEERRDAYFDKIHSNSDNPDWKAINAENFRLKGEERALKAQYKITESFLDGEILAEWKERGSNDVPGNIRICDYHPATDDVYVISDGGILWRGNLDGETWTPLNDNLKLNREVIKVVDLPDGGGVRIIAAIGYGLRYSDDNGETWTETEGLSGSNGRGIKLIQLNDAEKTLVYLYNSVSVIDGSSRNKIAYSTDEGENFTFVSDLATTSRNFASMDMAHNSSVAYVFDNDDDFYKFEGTELTLITTDLDLDGVSRCMIQVNETGGDLTAYVLMDNSSLYKSTDDGATFDFVNTLPTSPWNVGFEVSHDNPDALYYGEVNLYHSFDGGESFNLVSEWWEYYDDVANYIHADIMSIEPYKNAAGEEFTLVPNHGGIYVSYDNLENMSNISIQDLNTGQFYDVLTDPQDPSIIYGGTQDQGFQRTLSGDSPEASAFEQVISGDYGEMQFTNEGETIWIQYPGAWFQIYPDAATDSYYSYEFDVGGSDMPNVNWIVPTGAAPNATDDFIYVGGGNLEGGSGSHLIKLTFTGTEITSSQFDFDFNAASGANISAIETTPYNSDLIFVVTENGRFYYSEDEGDSFTQTVDYIGPSGGWIRTADIYASRNTEGLVFVGGSGYGGASVYMSTNGAESFVGLTGLPSTMVHEMTMDTEEKYLFAATDAGPYVYSVETEEWYDIAGLSAPLQQYISVEFIPSEEIVRFATWGRGIWDFDMTADLIDDASIAATTNENLISVYPNPASSQHITVSVSENAQVRLFDLSGKLVLTEQLTTGSNLIDISQLIQGTYMLVSLTKSGITHSKKIVIGK